MTILTAEETKALLDEWRSPDQGREKREALLTLLQNPVFREARALSTLFGPAPKSVTLPETGSGIVGVVESTLAGRYLFEKGVLDAFDRLENLTAAPPEPKKSDPRVPKAFKPEL